MDEQRTLDLEHESGLRPLGSDPEHCTRCHHAHQLETRQATCPHDTVDEQRTLSGHTFRVCMDCGSSL